jgi:hypothetical protein
MINVVKLEGCFIWDVERMFYREKKKRRRRMSDCKAGRMLHCDHSLIPFRELRSGKKWELKDRFKGISRWDGTGRRGKNRS